MGNNCCGGGHDTFICSEECSCVHPVITVTQQTLANIGTAAQPAFIATESWDAGVLEGAQLLLDAHADAPGCHSQCLRGDYVPSPRLKLS